MAIGGVHCPWPFHCPCSSHCIWHPPLPAPLLCSVTSLNAELGTSFSLRVVTTAGQTAVTRVTLSASTAGAFSQTVALPGGMYDLRVETSNSNGEGTATPWLRNVDVGARAGPPPAAWFALALACELMGAV